MVFPSVFQYFDNKGDVCSDTSYENICILSIINSVAIFVVKLIITESKVTASS